MEHWRQEARCFIRYRDTGEHFWVRMKYLNGKRESSQCLFLMGTTFPPIALLLLEYLWGECMNHTQLWQRRLIGRSSSLWIISASFDVKPRSCTEENMLALYRLNTTPTDGKTVARIYMYMLPHHPWLFKLVQVLKHHNNLYSAQMDKVDW